MPWVSRALLSLTIAFSSIGTLGRAGRPWKVEAPTARRKEESIDKLEKVSVVSVLLAAVIVLMLKRSIKYCLPS